jgi:hypothetical protein
MKYLEKFSFFGNSKKEEEEFARGFRESEIQTYKEEVERTGILVMSKVYDLFERKVRKNEKIENIFGITRFVISLVYEQYIEVQQLARPDNDNNFKDVKMIVKDIMADEEGYYIALYDNNNKVATYIDRYSILKINPDIPEGLDKKDIRKYNL